jgi:hypothetical protein
MNNHVVERLHGASTTGRDRGTFGDASTPRSARGYRILIFVNGWRLGRFIAHVPTAYLFVTLMRATLPLAMHFH